MKINKPINNAVLGFPIGFWFAPTLIIMLWGYHFVAAIITAIIPLLIVSLLFFG